MAALTLSVGVTPAIVLLPFTVTGAMSKVRLAPLSSTTEPSEASVETVEALEEVAVMSPLSLKVLQVVKAAGLARLATAGWEIPTQVPSAPIEVIKVSVPEGRVPDKEMGIPTDKPATVVMAMVVSPTAIVPV